LRGYSTCGWVASSQVLHPPACIGLTWLRAAHNLLGDKFTLHTQHWWMIACSMTEINRVHQFMVCIE